MSNARYLACKVTQTVILSNLSFHIFIWNELSSYIDNKRKIDN